MKKVFHILLITTFLFLRLAVLADAPGHHLLRVTREVAVGFLWVPLLIPVWEYCF